MLDDESSDLTNFNTIYSRYKLRSYPFGLNSAQDDFQRKIEETFENLNLGLIVDDIVIFGADDSEHDERLKAALERALSSLTKTHLRWSIILSWKQLAIWNPTFTTSTLGAVISRASIH
ncbi:hypothetical protein QYM36_001203, partial [Artemia franciscana]